MIWGREIELVNHRLRNPSGQILLLGPPSLALHRGVGSGPLMALSRHDGGIIPKAIRHPMKEDGGEEKIEGGNNHATANRRMQRFRRTVLTRVSTSDLLRLGLSSVLS